MSSEFTSSFYIFQNVTNHRLSSSSHYYDQLSLRSISYTLSWTKNVFSTSTRTRCKDQNVFSSVQPIFPTSNKFYGLKRQFIFYHRGCKRRIFLFYNNNSRKSWSYFKNNLNTLEHDITVNENVFIVSSINFFTWQQIL